MSTQLARVARRCALILFSGALLPVHSAQAQRAVWWTDFFLAPARNVIPGALTRAGIPFDAATSQADFNTRLASGIYSLAVFGEQDGDVFGGSSASLATFLAGGGSILGATWLNASGMSTFFQAIITSSNQGSISGTGPMFAGITTPLTLSNPGWGIFSQGSTGGTCVAEFADASCAALEGNGGRTLLLGPLFDTYADVPQGEQFVANGIGLLAADGEVVATPEPGSMMLLATGLISMVGAAGRRRKSLP